MSEPKQRITYGKFYNVDLRVAIVKKASLVTDAKYPMRMVELDLGPLGERRSLGKFALVDEDKLLGARVVVCVNLSPKEVGPYVSDALILGTKHPESPPDQEQSIPLWADSQAEAGTVIF